MRRPRQQRSSGEIAASLEAVRIGIAADSPLLREAIAALRDPTSELFARTALQEAWKCDPCWDIETTEGFEAHHDELPAFRLAHEAACEQAFLAQLQALAARERLTVDRARELYFAEQGATRAAQEAVATLRHLFTHAGLSYQDLDADLGTFVAKVVAVAVQESRAERIRAGST
jgi:hypothetical protein